MDLRQGTLQGALWHERSRRWTGRTDIVLVSTVETRHQPGLSVRRIVRLGWDAKRPCQIKADRLDWSWQYRWAGREVGVSF